MHEKIQSIPMAVSYFNIFYYLHILGILFLSF